MISSPGAAQTGQLQGASGSARHAATQAIASAIRSIGRPTVTLMSSEGDQRMTLNVERVEPLHAAEIGQIDDERRTDDGTA